MTFCPQEVVWGDLATWFGAAATFLAVVVALVTAGRAGKVAFAIRADERDVELSKERSLRHQLVVGFDFELYMLVGTLSAFMAQLAAAREREDWANAYALLANERPATGLTLMTRFAEKLDVFPAAMSGELLGILVKWTLIQESPPAEFSDQENLAGGLNGTIVTIESLIFDMQAARVAIRAFADDKSVLAPIEW